ncbi:MAG: hypothetical protein GIX03_03280 [Candidatus Eremiobacteraeota bacterium]|nr:hypothetical protein [Candidatus Eremiobacteraeota bacterium]MBC5802036.1 hypothetical protein [Candidatus Eremiobacteraeota bacterium]MBC5822560.1 hypothetical protein [Candidatus Eremiobacteraeota bacterium]
MNDYDIEQAQRGSGNAVKSAAHSASSALESPIKKADTNATLRSGLMAGAAASLFASLALKAAGSREDALFVGQWVPTFLIIALWVTIVREDVAPGT